jgi:glycosyltransferase involved in cell wall biosynthesis
MQAVLHLHEKHAVVAPRTNSPGYLSFPPDDDLPPSESHRIWEKLHRTLPRYYITPTASHSCLLIKGEVLERLPGLEDPDEFVRRINRYGYSTLAANWAYAFYSGTAPEPLTRQFQVDPVETFAMLEAPHRPRILYDLYHLPPQHSGTSDFALNLLRELEPLAREEFDIYVGAGEEQAYFLTDLCGYRLYDEKSSLPMVFDLVYKPCQIFRWPEFSRMTRLAPRVAFSLQDIIALRCDYIGNASLPPIFQLTVELSDLVVAISEASSSDYATYYRSDARMPVIYHGSYAQPAPGGTTPGEHILVMGNALTHKGVTEAVQCLGDDLPVVVLGGDPVKDTANIRRLESGQLSRRFIYDLFTNARIVVYPSYYEGYGLPVADALAFGKPVIVLDTAINREIASITNDSNLHRISSLSELQTAVRRLWNEPPSPSHSSPRRWSEAAAEYLAAFRELLRKDADVTKMRRRWETIRLIESLEPKT